MKARFRALWRPLLAALLLLVAVAPGVGARPRSLQDLAAITGKLVATGIKYGEIPSLYRPRYDRVSDADLSLSGDDVVFVVQLPDGPRIYPQSIMAWHQVVNEVVDDNAYAVTYCPITGTLMAYDASMGGLNLIFDPEGRLYDGNSVLVDRNSGSLWLQETGMAFDGPLLGRGLPQLPVFWTTWGAAKSVYPKAKVLARPPGNRAYGRDPYGSYARTDTYYQNDRLIYPVLRLDRRFPHKTPMLCLEYEGSLVAIDIKYVKKKGAVNFFVGPHALLAAYDGKLGVVRVFNRRVWNDPFLFIARYGKLQDLTTRSLWSPAPGKALDGHCHTAKGRIIDGWLGADTDEEFESLHKHGAKTIAIGDGGNELGTGKLFNVTRRVVDHGEDIAAAQTADITLASGVSNWWGWGIAAIASVYLNRNVLPDEHEERAVLRAILDAGAVDGITKRSEESIDNIDIDKHIALLNEVHSIVKNYLDKQAE